MATPEQPRNREAPREIPDFYDAGSFHVLTKTLKSPELLQEILECYNNTIIAGLDGSCNDLEHTGQNLLKFSHISLDTNGTKIVVGYDDQGNIRALDIDHHDIEDESAATGEQVRLLLANIVTLLNDPDSLRNQNESLYIFLTKLLHSDQSQEIIPVITDPDYDTLKGMLWIQILNTLITNKNLVKKYLSDKYGKYSLDALLQESTFQERLSPAVISIIKIGLEAHKDFYYNQDNHTETENADNPLKRLRQFSEVLSELDKNGGKPTLKVFELADKLITTNNELLTKVHILVNYVNLEFFQVCQGLRGEWQKGYNIDSDVHETTDSIAHSLTKMAQNNIEFHQYNNSEKVVSLENLLQIANDPEYVVKKEINGTWHYYIQRPLPYDINHAYMILMDLLANNEDLSAAETASTESEQSEYHLLANAYNSLPDYIYFYAGNRYTSMGTSDPQRCTEMMHREAEIQSDIYKMISDKQCDFFKGTPTGGNRDNPFTLPIFLQSWILDKLSTIWENLETKYWRAYTTDLYTILSDEVTKEFHYEFGDLITAIYDILDSPAKYNLDKIEEFWERMENAEKLSELTTTKQDSIARSVANRVEKYNKAEEIGIDQVQTLVKTILQARETN
jgi:hypothetical protein